MRLHSLVFLFCAASVAAFAQPVPVAGPNVNMVSGTTWPDGDPYLQRQNEGSIAVSSRNSAHLLAASNDYRTVDLVNDGTGDAWLGVFKSFDGGQTWKSTLLPGCPYNTPQCVTNPPSPISGLQAAADPTVRAGTNGMFYLSGLAANRGTNPLGAVFVARFIDNNNAEKTSADPIQYLDTMVIESGTSGRFVDKPWLAADIPRAGAAMCNVAGQQFPAGNVYLVYSVFTGSKSSKIMFTVSKDCGAHWNTPTKLSESNSVNQGTILAIDPATGNVYVAWRRFVVSNQPDAILIAKSTDFGQTFSKAVELPGMIPFDQGTTGVSFRTNAYPALAVSYDEATKISRVHLAWSQRGVGPSGDARIVMSTSRDGKTWPAPVAVDSPAAPRFPNLSARGHQIMPAMTFAAGRLMIVYYDASEDSTVGELVCQGCDTVAARTEVRNLAGNLAAGSPGSVFNSAIADQAPAGLPPLIRRHTLDVRVAEALPADTPVFVSTRVSQYLFGSSSGGSLGSKPILQIKSFPPDLPLFSQGTLPFIGDYLDLTAQNFVPGPDGKSWQFNTNPANQPVFHAVWTDNRDVQPPPDGDWTKYTPPGPNCIPGRAGMRNQNIYTSRITEGLAVSVVGNAKKLNASTPATFVVTVQNNTNRTTTYQLTITPPAGVTASFQKPPAPVTLSLIVMVAPRSSASRPVFATSTVGTIPIAVKVVETTPPANQAPQQSSVSLNPDTYAPANFDLTNGELYNVGLVNFDLTNVPVANFDLTNIDLKNFDLTNFDLTNFDLTNIGTPNFDLTNADVANFDLTNSAIKNFDLTNSALTDVTWKITNTGNTTTSYNTKLLLKDQIPAGFKLQLVLYKVYKTPTAGGAGRCSVGEQPQRVVVASIPNPTFGSPSDPNLGVPDLTTSDVTNATLPLAPGEEGRITLRILGNAASATNLATNSVKTVVVAHPGAIALVITQTQTLPDAISGSPYSATLQALGGTAPLTWTLLSGSLPQGLQLSSGGVISGTPGGSGQSTFTVQVADASSQKDTQTLSLTVLDKTAPVITASAAPYVSGTWTNQNVLVTFTCTDNPGGSGVASLTPPVTVSTEGANQSVAGTCTDNAGNSASATFSGINIDKTAPVIAITTPANGASFARNAVVNASFACTDAASGIATCSGTVANGAGIDTSTLGAKTFLVAATDKAGNPATLSYSYTVIDVTAPVITASAGAYVSGTWTNQNVVVTFACTDEPGGSGVASVTPPVTVSTQGANQSVTGTCTDNAGNSASATFSGINIDKTAPVITITTPASGAGYALNAVVNASFACTDTGSGVATCSGTVANGAAIDTGALGQKTFTVNASDNAGNTATLSYTYTVIDVTAPVITASAGAYVSGTWTNQHVVVTFACTDEPGGSGVASVTPPVTVSTQGAN
ncbi:MAG: hypothetical protein HYR60_07335, partial [Acidobacteria bacterium]|nr:hypothetical protein [Acidobacteriota bacterium]